MAEIVMHCPEIHCDGCANSINRSLSKLDGVQKTEVDIPHKQVSVQYDPAKLDIRAIQERLTRAGFPPQ